MSAKRLGMLRVLFAGLLCAALIGWGGGGVFAAPANSPATSVKGCAAKDDGSCDKGPGGAVYVLTNEKAGNAIAVFKRAANGTLAAADTVATGGVGTGGGLGSQGALALSADGHWLFAVNAGSNDISVLRVEGDGVTLVGRQPAGGTLPISLTIEGDLLYVLNAGSNNITGFRVGLYGTLWPVAGSTRPLSGANVGPAQVSFAPGGASLVVTEKMSNQIDVYQVGADGVAAAPVFHPSAGTTPFGFAFAGPHLIVSDAFGGQPNAGAVSSYTLGANGELATATAASLTYQTAPCWVAATADGRYAYTTNAGSGSITGYAVSGDGQLRLLTGDGRTGVLGAGSRPLDLGFSQDSRYLYALAAGTQSVSAFRVESDGGLAALGAAGGLPASAVGLVAR